ncbi:glycosyltransferase family 4 protein [Nocardiopsis sp. CNT-189]|uniref:glycosyltransferase family 4 protein n=1 Tax=Nocardiopsis oceanisediminis TaxID=2816862 RepID=UPI003B330717
MKIVYLIHNLYGIGGTIRTVINQAEALAELGHGVEVVSVFRHREDPVLPVGPRVGVRPVIDLRDPPAGESARRPSRLYPAEEKLYRDHSAASDELIAQALAEAGPDVAVGTRAGLNILLTRLPLREDGIAVVGQEHLTHRMYGRDLMAAMSRAYPHLSALVPVTEADAAAYRERMRLPGVVVRAIPNCVPEPALTAGGAPRRTVAAAGRLTGMKGYDLLIDAFARVSDEHPGWTLRIYGRGKGLDARRRQIAALGLHDRAFMMGPHPRMDEAWAVSSFCAVTSRDEPFGMTIVEAMRAGLPVLSTDCPFGPAEIITDGHDGLLVPNGDVGAIADGLDRLMGDDALRTRMAAAALESSRRYAPEAIARRHEELFTDLLATPSVPAQRSARTVRPTAPPDDEPAPDHCAAEAAADGSVRLRFARPPQAVVLQGEEGEQLIPAQNGSVPITPADIRRAGGACSVLRRDEDGAPVPVPATLLDLRSAPAPASDDLAGHPAGLEFVLPQRAAAGLLRVSVRGAARYAEVRDVQVAAEAVTVTGSVLGAGRGDPDGLLVLRPGAGADRITAAAPVDASGMFTAAVPTSEVATGHSRRLSALDDPAAPVNWSLVLRAFGAEHRVGRLLLGAADWSRITGYPHAVACADGRGGAFLVQPRYTRAGRLALRSAPCGPDESADPLAHAVSDLAVRWATPEPLPSLLISGAIRSQAVSADSLRLLLVGDAPDTVPLPLSTEQDAGGVYYTAWVTLARRAVPFGRRRVVLQTGGALGDAEPGCPDPPGPHRWWIGPLPVYARIREVDGATVIEYAPIDLPQALRKRIRRWRRKLPGHPR